MKNLFANDKNFSKINSEEHKQYMIDIYNDLKTDPTATAFERLVAEAVIRKLNAGILPRKIEKWETKLRHLWNKLEI